MKKTFCRITFLAAFAACLAGCMFNSREVTIQPVSLSGERKYFQNELINMDGLSYGTQNFLEGNLLINELSKAPEQVLAKLNEYFRISGNQEYLVIAADICRYLAAKAPADEAIRYHLSCFQYCQDTIFSGERNGKVFAADLIHGYLWTTLTLSYNEACCGIFRYMKKAGILHSDSVTFQGINGRKFVIEKPEYRLSVPVSALEDIALCSSYTVKNLRQINRRFGLGVPLTVRLKPQAIAGPLRVPNGLTIPVTLLLRPVPRPDGNAGIRLVFQDTCLAETLSVQNGEWRLALDYSTPLACFLDTLTQRNLLSVMLNPLKYENSTGLYILEPYQKQKIPVVFIHGLMSSPETWVQMINSLRNDPQIRKNFQFWFFLYSSGSPVTATALELRKALLAAEKEFCATPEGKKNFNRMILTGHSMGGLVTRMLIQQDPDYILTRVTGLSREELKPMLLPEDMKILNDTFHLPPLPYVSRAVFMAVPHKGAAMAQIPLARFGTRIIRLPASMLSRSDNMSRILAEIEKNPKGKKHTFRFYTGIDSLDPDNDLVQAIGSSSIRSGLPYHSIIGDRKGDNIPGGSDGVVPYSSSHLDGAVSELIVRSDHSVHRRPAAIRELMRILHEHLKAVSGKKEK